MLDSVQEDSLVSDGQGECLVLSKGRVCNSGVDVLKLLKPQSCSSYMTSGNVKQIRSGSLRTSSWTTLTCKFGRRLSESDLIGFSRRKKSEHLENGCKTWKRSHSIRDIFSKASESIFVIETLDIPSYSVDRLSVPGFSVADHKRKTRSTGNSPALPPRSFAEASTNIKYQKLSKSFY